MYPFLRMFYHSQKAKKLTPFENPFEVSKVSMRVTPLDIDIFMELNNGRYLTLMDIGRFELSQRLQLPKVLKKNNWGLMVGAVNSRYRYRLKLFQKFTLNTQIHYFDERWFYFHQWFTTSPDKIHASFLVRTAVTSKQGLVPTQQVVEQLNFNQEYVDANNKKSEWLEQWVLSDEIHKKIMEPNR